MKMAHHEAAEGRYGPHMKTVALSILVMGISLAVVILLWVSFGWISPKFSDQVLRNQQEDLREKYGLDPLPHISEQQAQIPPSLRDK